MESIARIAPCLALLSVCATSARALDDPGVPGPYDVTRVEYDLGTFQTENLNVPSEVLASVHYPDPLPSAPVPLVIMLHGGHATCYDPETDATGYVFWPCTPDDPVGLPEPFPSYIGYDYLAEVLASHGYIVASISSNAAQAVFTPALTPIVKSGEDPTAIQARAELIQHHLGQWATWNSSGGAPVTGGLDPDLFQGHVDMERIGTFGHSKGGEGVIRHVLWNAKQPGSFDVQAVMAVTPTDYRSISSIESAVLPAGETPLSLDDVAFGLVVSYCDGDTVWTEGIHHFDNTRAYSSGNSATRHFILAMGANHNYFNSTWTPNEDLPGGLDDGIGYGGQYPDDPHCGSASPRRLSPAEQRAFATTYAVAFFRRYLGGELRFEAVLTGHASPPPSAQTSDLVFSFHAPEAMRLDVNRMLNEDSLYVNDVPTPGDGHPVTQSGLSTYKLCGQRDLDRVDYSCLGLGVDDHRMGEPHANGIFLSPGTPSPGLGQLAIAWTDPGQSPPAFYRNDLPADTDIRGYYMLQFRAGVDFVSGALGASPDFSVKLTDGNGDEAVVSVSAESDVLYFPPGELGAEAPDNAGFTPKLLLNTVSIPLDGFTGIDRSDVRSIEFVFDRENSEGDVEGSIVISDIAFASLPGVQDSDHDGVIDTEDACSLLDNQTPTACDTDKDGYGNHCDADLDNNGVVNGLDFSVPGSDNDFLDCYISGSDPSDLGCDMNCDGLVNGVDYTLYFYPMFSAGLPPGPSGLYCAGTIPCP